MIIQPVDDQLDLFLVKDILPGNLIDKINKEDLWNYTWEKQGMQTDWNRRRLLPHNDSPLLEVDKYYNEALGIIENIVNIEFEDKKCWSSFWLDHEGFTCNIHEDGAERGYTPLLAMQIYLNDDDSYKLGTVFYKDYQGTQVRYSFPYIRNTGYLMINRPGQWHGMLNAVPVNYARFSSYTYFGKFNHK